MGKDKSEKKRRKEQHSEPLEDDTESCLKTTKLEKERGPDPGRLRDDNEKDGMSGGSEERKEALTPKRKSKSTKKTKKVRSGCWTAEMIQESIRDLESKLNNECEQLSKSKKRRIIMRLSKLKKGLRGEIEIGGQIQKSIKTIKREMKQKSMSSSISLRKNSNVVCLCCRKKGHQMSDCRYYSQTLDEGSGEGGKETGPAGEKDVFKCFLCGKLGHTLKDCEEPRNDNSVLPFASCFRCGKSGHIVAFCPENETGSIYPRGGSCNLCGSVKHLARNCDQQVSKVNKNKKQLGASKGKDRKMSILTVDDPDVMWKEAMQ